MVQAVTAKPDPKDLARLIEKNLEIPSIPDVAARALRALNDDRTTAAKVAQIIAEDQGMTARVLKVANSALYGLTREITNLQQAAMVMGFDSLRGIIITVSNRAIYKRFGAVEKELWQHSVATAIAAQHIAAERSLERKDEAFVCGLMHDVGKVVMNNGMRDQFMASRQLADDQHVPDIEAEQSTFGFSHCDVGSLLVQRWGLSEHLEHAVFLHHEPDLAPMLAGDSEPLVYVTHVADQICYRLGYGKGSGREAGETVDIEAFCSLGFEAEDLGPLCQKVEATYQETHGSF
ncbi:MAG: HDOD domain-containing protein [Myxococcota bacterium]